jgi:hypothetical protein
MWSKKPMPVELGLARAVEVDLDGDLGLIGITGYFGLSHITLLDL